MEKLYICSPLNAPTQRGICKNMENARRYEDRVTQMFSGVYKAVAPHAHLPHILDDNDPKERALALDFGRELLKMCSGIVICGDTISSGMSAEIKLARELGLEFYHYSERDVYSIIESEGGIYKCHLFLNNEMWLKQTAQ